MGTLALQGSTSFGVSKCLLWADDIEETVAEPWDGCNTVVGWAAS